MTILDDEFDKQAQKAEKRLQRKHDLTQKYLSKIFNRLLRNYTKTAQKIAKNNGTLKFHLGTRLGIEQIKELNLLSFILDPVDLGLSKADVESNSAYQAFRNVVSQDGYTIDIVTKSAHISWPYDEAYMVAASVTLKIIKLAPGQAAPSAQTPQRLADQRMRPAGPRLFGPL